MLLWQPAVRACRLFIAEAERIPEASANYYDAIFETAHERLTTFLSDRYQLAPAASTSIANELFGRTLYPRLVRDLLGVEDPRNNTPEPASIAADVDLGPIRDAVASLLRPRKIRTR
jgi:hypothetical protein